jgi:hypothetical protein
MHTSKYTTYNQLQTSKITSQLRIVCLRADFFVIKWKWWINACTKLHCTLVVLMILNLLYFLIISSFSVVKDEHEEKQYKIIKMKFYETLQINLFMLTLFIMPNIYLMIPSSCHNNRNASIQVHHNKRYVLIIELLSEVILTTPL